MLSLVDFILTTFNSEFTGVSMEIVTRVLSVVRNQNSGPNRDIGPIIYKLSQEKKVDPPKVQVMRVR